MGTNDFQKPSRRGVLKKGFWGTLVLAMGAGAGLALRGSREVAIPLEGLKVLSAREFAVVTALADRFIPPRAGFPSPVELRVALVVDDILSKVDVTAQAEVKQLLGLFENALPNFLFGLRVKPFTQSAPEVQDATLHDWLTSRLAVRRTGFFALRGLVMAAYYGNPATWPAVQYDGPPQGFASGGTGDAWKGGGVPRPPGNGVWVEPL